MIIRLWLITGTLLVAVAWGLTVFVSPADFQKSAGTAVLEKYRTAKQMPAAGEIRLSSAIDHAVFEIPAADAVHLKLALASGGGMAGMQMAMPAMKMDMASKPAMKMDVAIKPDDHGAKPAMKMDMPGMKMDMASKPVMKMDMPGMKMGMASKPAMKMKMPGMKMDMAAKPAVKMDMPGMKMDMASKPAMKIDVAIKPDDYGAKPAMKMKMPGMNMDMAARPDDHGAAETGGGHSAAGSGLTILASGATGGHGMIGPKAYMNARRIELAMTEWGYSAPSLTVRTGEVVRFVVTNKGSMPHEFMLMSSAGMQAVNYRLQRADWNLTEHEAPYENPIVMPGDTFELLIRADRPGMWMYMCMFPYHMQLGMMGMLMASADGAAGSGAMTGMKMDMKTGMKR